MALSFPFMAAMFNALATTFVYTLAIGAGTDRKRSTGDSSKPELEILMETERPRPLRYCGRDGVRLGIDG